jgi:hypothetical protein
MFVHQKNKYTNFEKDGKSKFFSESFFDFSKLDKKNVQNRESEKNL